MQGDPLSGLADETSRRFLTTYATSGVEEDKAEMFAHMMTDYATVGKRATHRLGRSAQKMSAMKSLLGDLLF